MYFVSASTPFYKVSEQYSSILVVEAYVSPLLTEYIRLFASVIKRFSTTSNKGATQYLRFLITNGSQYPVSMTPVPLRSIFKNL